jgi:hypothetical protein
VTTAGRDPGRKLIVTRVSRFQFGHATSVEQLGELILATWLELDLDAIGRLNAASAGTRKKLVALFSAALLFPEGVVRGYNGTVTCCCRESAQ